MPPKRKTKPWEHLKQHLRKNKIGAVVVIFLLLGAAYVLSSESRSPEQMRAMEGIEGTVAKFADVSNSLRSVLRKQWGFSTSENRSKAAGLWESMNSYQREQEVVEVLEKLRAGPFAKAAADLGTTDMVRMFQAACPDVISKEFSESHSKLWSLLDAWFKASSQEGLSGESRQNLDEVIKLGFWSGVSDLKFSEADVQKFSAIGWAGIRDVVLGIFFKGLGADLVNKQERLAAGETGVLPEAPVPWSAEPEAQVVVFASRLLI